MKTEAVHWCSKCQMSTTNDQESETCPDGHDMASIGWICTASKEGGGTNTATLPTDKGKDIDNE